MTGAAHDPGISAKLRYTTSTDMTLIAAASPEPPASSTRSSATRAAWRSATGRTLRRATEPYGKRHRKTRVRGHFGAILGLRRAWPRSEVAICRYFTMPEEGLEPPTRGL